jgi:putative salt-induced outer membrane protein YdiY
LRFRLALALCALSLISALARADEIQFTNGDKLTGKVVKMKDGKLGFDSKMAGTIAVNWADVATLSTDEPVTVQLEGGEILVDKLVAAEPGTVKTAGSESVTQQTIPLASAAKVNPEPVEWKGAVLAGAELARGNTNKNAATVGIDAVRRSELDRITFGAGYASEETEDADEVGRHSTKRKMFGALQYDYFFTKQLYGYGNARGEKDGPAELALRFTAGVGGGYQWIETDTLKWNTEAGLSWVSESFTDATPNNDYLALRLASNLDWVLYPGLTFFQYTRWYPSLEALDDQLVEASTGLRYKIWGDFFGESKVVFVWDSTPAESKRQEDLTYILGIGYSF